jgi:hypothetical protein
MLVEMSIGATCATAVEPSNHAIDRIMEDTNAVSDVARVDLDFFGNEGYLAVEDVFDQA